MTQVKPGTAYHPNRIPTARGSQRDTAPYTVYTSLLFNSQERKFEQGVALTINPITGLITSVQRDVSPTEGSIQAPDLDLRGYTVLPGLVDSHTHIYLHSYTEASATQQMRDESLIERTVRATNHCCLALKAGYTTYRDLGTEGAYNADIGVRNSVNRGLIPGPRLFVATEAIASSGGYEVRQENHLGPIDGGLGTTIPRTADYADGVAGVTAAARRRVAAGADVIKFYSEYRRRTLRFPQQQWSSQPPILHPPYTGPGPLNMALNIRNPASILFDQEEMNAICAEGRRAKIPVAAHAFSPEAVIMASNAGVTTIEHGTVPSEDALKTILENKTIYVPTLAVIESEITKDDEDVLKSLLAHVKRAHDLGVRLACGGDTGAFNHGENVREVELFLKAGVPLEDTLRAATLGGWEACGAELSGFRFGSLEEGWSADLVVLKGDVRRDISALRNVDMVVKDGKVVVSHGQITELV